MKKISIRCLLALCLTAVLLAGCGKQAGFYVEQQGEQLESGQNDAADLDENGQDAGASAGEKNQGGSAGEKNQGASETLAADKNRKENKTDQDENRKADTPRVCVQVCGAVKNPGVYFLPEGSRIFEAVALAGGMNPEADLTAVNQAQVITDGQMVYVYSQGEAAQAPGASGTGQDSAGAAADDGRVNINTAAADELMTLPGIGESKAQCIISWREEHGAFKKTEDIMNIEGIKEGVFSKIKDQIKIN